MSEGLFKLNVDNLQWQRFQNVLTAPVGKGKPLLFLLHSASEHFFFFLLMSHKNVFAMSAVSCLCIIIIILQCTFEEHFSPSPLSPPHTHKLWITVMRCYFNLIWVHPNQTQLLQDCPKPSLSPRGLQMFFRLHLHYKTKTRASIIVLVLSRHF